MTHPVEGAQKVANHIYWLLILTGLFFIALAVLILLYPPLLFVLVAVAFAGLGATFLAAAWKLNRLWGQLPGFLKINRQ